jgi:hypothetical protein
VRKTVRDWVWVAAAIKTPFRKDGLALQTHKECASAPERQQLLDQAESNEWSAVTMRKQAREINAKDAERPTDQERQLALYHDFLEEGRRFPGHAERFAGRTQRTGPKEQFAALAQIWKQAEQACGENVRWALQEARQCGS